MSARRKAGSRVLYVQYTNPAAYPPLEHSSRILAAAGWEALFLGTGAAGASALRFAPDDRIHARLVAFVPSGWRQKLHYAGFSLWVLGRALLWRPAWVYASESLSCPVGLALSFLPGVRVIYHEHDLPSPAGRGGFQWLIGAARRVLARRAQICVLPNRRRAEQFAGDTGTDSEVLCVWNCPTRDEVVPERPPHKGGVLWVLYHGSIVPSRLPLAALRALTLLPETVKLRVIGYETVGHRGYLRRLQEAAAEYGIAGRVEFVGAVPERHELLAWCRRCDVGLAFMPRDSADANERNMVGASNKPFDYMACGLALLVSDLPEWRSTYVEPGYGLACDGQDPASIAGALGWFLRHPEAMRAMGERGRLKVLSDWNYETQFAPVLGQMLGEGR